MMSEFTQTKTESDTGNTYVITSPETISITDQNYYEKSYSQALSLYSGELELASNEHIDEVSVTVESVIDPYFDKYGKFSRNAVTARINLLGFREGIPDDESDNILLDESLNASSWYTTFARGTAPIVSMSHIPTEEIQAARNYNTYTVACHMYLPNGVIVSQEEIAKFRQITFTVSTIFV